MRRLGIALWSALFGAVIVVGSVQAQAPFPAWHQIWESEKDSVMFQLALMDAATGEAKAIERVKVLEAVDEAVTRLDELGHRDCFADYAITARVSLGMFRPMLELGIVEGPWRTVASTIGELWNAMERMRPTIETRCHAIEQPMDLGPQPLINRPLA